MIETDPFSDGAADRTLAELFAARVRQSPQALAAKAPDEDLSYAELDIRANRLAQFIRSLGIGPGDIVAIVMERSTALSVALWGVLKTGAAYLPIDPVFPEARRAFMLQDAGVALVVTEQRFERLLIDFEYTVFRLDADCSYLDDMPGSAPELPPGNDHLAYVLYTSGSTGNPKGCMLTHRAVVNRLLWMQKAYPIGPDDRILQKTVYTFDVSVWELFWPHLFGAALIYAKPGGHRDNRYLATLIEDEGVSVCHFVPAMLRLFLMSLDQGRCSSLRHLFASGEALPYPVMTDCLKLLPGAALHNLYGPTEAAIDVLYWDCRPRTDGKVPIGAPIDNIRVYLLKDDLCQSAPGEAGEICIAGVGLAAGYLNQPELTTIAFVDAPPIEGESRIYRTGDIGRLLPDGLIEYCGRRDSQIKLRGQRIELGEIEERLQSHSAISSAVATVQDEAGEDPKLVAYFVAADTAPDIADIKRHLAESLPAGMLPNFYHPMTALPLSVHGKVDRKRLPWPLEPMADPPAEVLDLQAQTPLGFVIEILDEGIGRSISPDEDLFDQGATSLTLALLAERIHERYGVELPLQAFMEQPTALAIAAHIDIRPVTRGKPPVGPSSAVSPQAEGMPIEAAILRHANSELGLAVTDPHDDLFDAGATSLTLVQLVEWVATEFGTVVEAETLLDAPSAAKIAALVAPDASPDPAMTPAPPRPAFPGAGETRIELPPVRFAETAFARTRAVDGELSLDMLGKVLSGLRGFDYEGTMRYSYASSGGLNSVHTYIWVDEGRAEGFPAGAYYYHPLEHRLYRTGSGAELRGAFKGRSEHGGPTATLVLIADFAAIAPIYREASAPLTFLEAGYMAQALHRPLADADIVATPISCAEPTSVRRGFALSDNQHYLHALSLGESNLIEASGPVPDRSERTENIWQLETIMRGVPERSIRNQADQEAFYAEKLHLRRFPHDTPTVELPDQADTNAELYPIRACQRTFKQQALTSLQLARLVALFRSGGPNNEYLYRNNGVHDLISLRLFVRPGAVQGVTAGFYDCAIDGVLTATVPYNDSLAAGVEASFGPSNRPVYREAGIVLFFVADRNAIERCGGRRTAARLYRSRELGPVDATETSRVRSRPLSDRRPHRSAPAFRLRLAGTRHYSSYHGRWVCPTSATQDLSASARLRYAS